MVYYGKEAREKLIAGVHKLARAVIPTLGPRGRYAILAQEGHPPAITNDGVTIAQHLKFEDKVESVGADLIREVAAKTNEVAGDGTTTATLLADKILTIGMEEVESGRNPVDIRDELARDGTKVVDYLRTIARPVGKKEELRRIISLASRDETIGTLVSDILWKLGKDAKIAVQTGHGMGITSEVAAGFQFDGGYMSPSMITNTKTGNCDAEDVLILVTNKKIELIDEIFGLMEEVAESGKRNLLIIADDVFGSAIKNIELNRKNGVLKVMVVRPVGTPERQREIIQDIAAVTGAKPFWHEGGDNLRTATIGDLGHAESVSASQTLTTIIGGAGDREIRKAELFGALQSATDPVEKMVLEQRLSRISGLVGVVEVGGRTETEITEKKFRVDDGIRAGIATLEDGVIPGGGVALENAAELIESKILKKALQEPRKTLDDNAGEKLPVEGIIDPFKVTHTALQNAISVASLILLSESVAL
jgi:chaperonin GroEL